jgi:uncharacterized protein (TIGR02246 family)
MTVQEWIEAYRRAWNEKDADAAANLFTEDSSYLDFPFGEPHPGQDGVRAYWQQVTSTQEDVNARFGDAIATADGRRAAVEFWVTMLNGGAPTTLTGILFLRFASDGRCEDLREAWHFTEGILEPPAIWGS